MTGLPPARALEEAEKLSRDISQTCSKVQVEEIVQAITPVCSVKGRCQAGKLCWPRSGFVDGSSLKATLNHTSGSPKRCQPADLRRLWNS